jgi:hypothetical protein
MVLGLMRLNRQYQAEDQELIQDAPLLAARPALRRHNVIVLVDKLDVAAARAIQYGRSLDPYEFRAVHFDLDPWKSQLLTEEWRKLGFGGLALDVVECPDRRLSRAALETVMDVMADGDCEVTVLIPRREYERAWHRLLHDRSSESIVKVLSSLPHCNPTIVPYHLGSARPTAPAPTKRAARAAAAASSSKDSARPSLVLESAAELPADRTRIVDIPERTRATVAGRVRATRVQPWSGNPSLECTLVDDTGPIVLVFLGRRDIAGLRPGCRLQAEGMVATRDGQRVIINPSFDFLVPSEPLHAPTH